MRARASTTDLAIARTEAHIARIVAGEAAFFHNANMTDVETYIAEERERLATMHFARFKSTVEGCS